MASKLGTSSLFDSSRWHGSHNFPKESLAILYSTNIVTDLVNTATR